MYGYAENSGYKWMPKVSEVYRWLLGVGSMGPSKRIAGESMTFLRKTALASGEFRHKFTTRWLPFMPDPDILPSNRVPSISERAYRFRSSFCIFCSSCSVNTESFTLWVATGRWQIVSWVWTEIVWAPCVIEAESLFTAGWLLLDGLPLHPTSNHTKRRINTIPKAK